MKPNCDISSKTFDFYFDDGLTKEINAFHIAQLKSDYFTKNGFFLFVWNSLCLNLNTLVADTLISIKKKKKKEIFICKLNYALSTNPNHVNGWVGLIQIPF